MLSPLVGFVVAYLFRTEECRTIPGGTLGGIDYGSQEMCWTSLNHEAGAIVGLIILALAGLWLGLTILAEQSGSA